jgi:hypothetical protein
MIGHDLRLIPDVHETNLGSGGTASSAAHGEGAEGRADAALPSQCLQGERLLLAREVLGMLQPQLQP